MFLLLFVDILNVMDLRDIQKSASRETESSRDINALEAVKVKYLGRKGELTNILKSLKDLPITDRRRIGPEANDLKQEIEALINERGRVLREEAVQIKERIDITRPGHKMSLGHLHPLTQVDREIRRIFTSMNFSIVDGPEVETERYNFDALNIPKNHPARDMWDTFWLKQPYGVRERLLLRTHVSPIQIRYMEAHNPPFQILYPGLTFRYEATDASHEINFYQSEGLVVGSDITLTNFKFVIETFLKQFFSPQKVEFRFRPSYFPFTEPSLEVDIKIKGKWLEIMGAGMVHRNVFDAVRYNHNQVQGFAFGMGLDRLAMIKYNIPDIRLFYSGDLRFVRQF